MSVATIWRIHRTGRTNVPAFESATYAGDDWGVALGVFGTVAAASTGGVTASRGTVELSSLLAGAVELSDALNTTVEVSDG